MEVKAIMENRKDDFENEIKKYLEQGYKVQSSNIIVMDRMYSKLKPIPKEPEEILKRTILNTNIRYDLCFYALMIKE